MLSWLPPQFEGLDILLVEGALGLVAVWLAFVAPKLGDGFFRRAEDAFARLARRPVLSLVIVGLAPMVLRVSLQPMLHTPQPYIHDEFSYLLNGDTFAHGRVTNPPHPLWVFFETIHVLQQPTYNSQYPPGQGLFLAVGEVVAGRPWLGVMLSVGLMCSALLWMLRGWFPPEWALLGASIAVIRLGLFSYWMNSYWGGAVAALAGALIAGALPRLWQRGRTLDGAIFSVGLALLANSRPYEGFFFSLPFLAAVLWRRPPARAMAALSAFLIAGLFATGYYNWRVTGDALLMPHQLKHNQYAVGADFIFQKPRPEPYYNHPVLRDFYAREELTYATTPHSVWEFVTRLARREATSFWFFLGPLLVLPFLFANPKRLFRGRMAILTAALLLTLAALSLSTWALYPHYHAPATCAIYALLIQSIRGLRQRTVLGRPFGRFLSRAICCICAIMIVVRIAAEPLGIGLTNFPVNWANYNLGNFDRARMLAQLNSREGKSLVIVRYAEGHDPQDEWVFNGADIDGEKVIWAREMDVGNERLLDYFRDRHIYLIEPDVDRARLLPYMAR